jgi:hypothetical protein
MHGVEHGQNPDTVVISAGLWPVSTMVGCSEYDSPPMAVGIPSNILPGNGKQNTLKTIRYNYIEKRARRLHLAF